VADRVQHGAPPPSARAADASCLGSGLGTGSGDSGLTFPVDQTGGQVIPSRTLIIRGPVFGGQVTPANLPTFINPTIHQYIFTIIHLILLTINSFYLPPRSRFHQASPLATRLLSAACCRSACALPLSCCPSPVARVACFALFPACPLQSATECRVTSATGCAVLIRGAVLVESSESVLAKRTDVTTSRGWTCRTCAGRALFPQSRHSDGSHQRSP
jgi:hypothetical protein